jgi:hypothetical protein
MLSSGRRRKGTRPADSLGHGGPGTGAGDAWHQLAYWRRSSSDAARVRVQKFRFWIRCGAASAGEGLSSPTAAGFPGAVLSWDGCDRVAWLADADRKAVVFG